LRGITCSQYFSLLLCCCCCHFIRMCMFLFLPQELQPMISSLLHGTLAAQLAAQKAAAEQQRQQRLAAAAAAAAAAADGDVDWGSGGEEAMM
jgi:hypothetical protein